MDVISKQELSDAIGNVATRIRNCIDRYDYKATSNNQVQEAIARAFEELAEELQS